MSYLIFSAIKNLAHWVVSPLVLLFGLLTFRFRFISYWLWNSHHNRLNVFKTILVNFSSLPLKQAIHVPIFVFDNIDFINRGNIIVIGDVRPGMIRINHINWRTKSKTKIENSGTWILNPGVKIFGGSNIIIRPNAIFEMGRESLLGESTIVFVEENVKFGNFVTCTFGCVVTDTNSHFTLNLETGKTSKVTQPIEIGDFTWIGNNTSVKPGTITPHHTIVASSYSVLTKDYNKSVQPYSIIGGCPAKLIKSNCSRIWNHIEQRKLFTLNEKEISEQCYSKDDINALINPDLLTTINE